MDICHLVYYVVWTRMQEKGSGSSNFTRFKCREGDEYTFIGTAHSSAELETLDEVPYPAPAPADEERWMRSSDEDDDEIGA